MNSRDTINAILDNALLDTIDEPHRSQMLAQVMFTRFGLWSILLVERLNKRLASSELKIEAIIEHNAPFRFRTQYGERYIEVTMTTFSNYLDGHHSGLDVVYINKGQAQRDRVPSPHDAATSIEVAYEYAQRAASHLLGEDRASKDVQELLHPELIEKPERK